jgi:hypothetical protein
LLAHFAATASAATPSPIPPNYAQQGNSAVY